MPIQVDRLAFRSPLGGFLLAATEKGLCWVGYFKPHERSRAEKNCTVDLTRRFGPLRIAEDSRRLEPAVAWLRAFIEDPLSAGDYGGPLDPGGTEFQAAVWDALRAIPAGRTLSYGQLAGQVGNPRASRAVGAACGANPLIIFIPCHRAVGADRSLTGFGGGLPLKHRLLEAEGFFDPALKL